MKANEKTIVELLPSLQAVAKSKFGTSLGSDAPETLATDTILRLLNLNLEEIHCLPAFANTIIYHLGLVELRRNRLQEENVANLDHVPSREEDITNPIIKEEEKCKLLETLSQLGVQNAAYVLLSYYTDASIREISSCIDSATQDPVTLQAHYGRIRSALARLKQSVNAEKTR